MEQSEGQQQHPPDQGATPKSANSTKRIVAAVLLLGVFAGWYFYDMSTLHAEAQPILADLIAENQTPGMEVAGSVTVAREAVIFGTPLAKVEVFFRASADAASPISGIEYHYVRGEEGWRLTDSGMCSSDRCEIRGAKFFR